jgi:hypothetical protein
MRVLAVLGAMCVLAAVPASAHAAHPCGTQDPELRPIGTLYAGEVSGLRYAGAPPLLVSWGDGTRSSPRIRGNRLRHRFRRAGRLTIRLTTPGGACCDARHERCSPMPDRVSRVRVTVRRRAR